MVNREMKTLVVAEQLPAGGYMFRGSGVDDILRLSNRGVRIHIVNRPPRSIRGSALARIQTRGKRKIISLLKRRKDPVSGYREQEWLKQFRRVIKAKADQIGVHLVHAFGAYPEGFAAAEACRLLKKPLVVTTRGVDILVEKSIGYGYRLEPTNDVAVRKTFEFASKILVPSTYVKEIVLQLEPKKSKVEVVPWGIDLNVFRPSIDSLLVKKRHSLSNSPVVLVLISESRGPRPEKGLEYLLRAIPHVKKTIPDVKLVIVGLVPLIQRWHELSDVLGVKDNILFVGEVPHTETPSYYAAADMVVVPSLSEALPLVGIEAAACSKPLIASHVGGVPEIVYDGENGLLYPPRDSRTLAEKIVKLILQPSLRHRMGERGRRLAEEKFDSRLTSERILSLYQQVIGGK